MNEWEKIFTLVYSLNECIGYDITKLMTMGYTNCDGRQFTQYKWQNKLHQANLVQYKRAIIITSDNE